MTDSPLVMSREELRQRVEAVLSRYVRVVDGEIVTLSPWLALSNERQIMVYLSLRLALGQTDTLAPVDIERATGIPGGSVRPALMRLLRRRLVERTVYGQYRARLSAWAVAERWASDGDIA